MSSSTSLSVDWKMKVFLSFCGDIELAGLKVMMAGPGVYTVATN